jgi:hypothetical protein
MISPNIDLAFDGRRSLRTTIGCGAKPVKALKLGINFFVTSIYEKAFSNAGNLEILTSFVACNIPFRNS